MNHQAKTTKPIRKRVFPQVATKTVGCRCAGFVSAALIWSLLSMYGQPVAAPEYNLKAGFLTRFPQYTTWPTNAMAGSNSPIVIGVFGSDPFGLILDKTAADQKGGPALIVRRVSTTAEAAQCQVMFIPKSESRNEAGCLAALKGKPILTVGESGQTIARGGIVEFQTVGKTIRFNVSLPAMETAGLKLSSQMLEHAKTVQRTFKQQR